MSFVFFILKKKEEKENYPKIFTRIDKSHLPRLHRSKLEGSFFLSRVIICFLLLPFFLFQMTERQLR